jgi:Nucleotidyltransferase domain
MLTEVVRQLSDVTGIVAVVLGGSYATGLARPNSDIDIGLYYRESSPFSIGDVRFVAEEISASNSAPVVTEIYGWGPWVNGGAWIETPEGKVDFIYRNLDQVQTVISEGQRGIWRHDYDQQPPYGFRSIVYFGELQICVPLYDPQSAIAQLKEVVSDYPELLRDRVVQDSLWGAEFSLLSCRGFADKAEVCNAVGCMTRAAQFLIHAVFALNRQYFVNDKNANRTIDGFPLQPRAFTRRLEGVLASPGSGSAALNKATEQLTALWLETVDLTAGEYRPRWGSAARDKLATSIDS